MNNRIFFFRTKDEKIFLLSKNDIPIEITNPKTPNKEEILSIAKLYSRKSDTRISNKCFRDYNAKATFSTTVDNFMRCKFINICSELHLLD